MLSIIDRELDPGYPLMGLFFSNYEEFEKSPIKSIIYHESDLRSDIPRFKHLRNIIRNKSLRQSEDLLLNGIYYINHQGNLYIQHLSNIMERSLKDYIVFVDAFNLAADIVPDNPSILKVYHKDECVMIDGKYWLPKVYEHMSVRIPYVNPTVYHHKVGDIFKYGFLYQYDKEQMQFFYNHDLNQCKLRFFKGRIRFDILRYLGDTDERLADYSRLIYSMFKTSNLYQTLSPSVREKVDTLAMTDEKSIERLVDRDLRIQDIIEGLTK